MLRKNLAKKAAAVLMATTMVASMAGCGSSTSSTATTETPAADTAATTDASATTEAAGAEDLKGEETTIKVMVWDRGNAAPGTTTEDNKLTQWIQQQVKDLYNINVEYVSVPRSETNDKINIMMSGGTAPDIIFTYDQALFYNYASNGALHDLTDAYAKYGSTIAQYCGEAQDISMMGDQKFAVMKQRGTESARHLSYIRKDWLDELGMEVPKTKAELGEYLKAVKEKGLGGDKTIPWAMSGRADTEKMYLNFLGSYVDLPSDKEAYVYSEAYMAVAPGSKDGLKQLNEWYNEGLITQDFPTDTAEDVYMADISNGSVGFVNDDVSHAFASFEVLNNAVGKETFVPVECFDLADGSYRLPFEYRHAMYVMVPSTTSDANVDACMKYLNWMADPEVATNIRYTPDHKSDANGVAIDFTADELSAAGYPGTPDDLGIVNNNFAWVQDVDTLANTSFENQSTQWATLDWWKSMYNMQVKSDAKFRFPVYSSISEDEQTYGSDVETRMIEFVYKMICCPADQFDANYDAGYTELVNAGLQKILDARSAYYDSVQ